MDTSLLKELRDRTKASMSDCSKALKECDTFEAAVEWLKKKGIVDGLGIGGESKEGIVVSYIHPNNKIGVLLEVGCQTDFVGRNEDFQKFCKDVAMHIAGNDPFPRYVKESDIDKDEVIAQTTFYMDKTKEEKGFKPNTPWEEIPEKQRVMIEKIASGRLSKWSKEICLLNQKFVKDPKITVAEFVAQTTGVIKEKIEIRKFTRYQIS